MSCLAMTDVKSEGQWFCPVEMKNLNDHNNCKISGVINLLDIEPVN